MTPIGASIKQVSELTGVEIHTLRYWETEFRDHLRPSRTNGGQRRYSRDDIESVIEIRNLLRDEMFSIAGARKALRARQEQRIAA